MVAHRIFPKFFGNKEYEMRSVDVHAMYPIHRSLSAKVRVFINALVTK